MRKKIRFISKFVLLDFERNNFPTKHRKYVTKANFMVVLSSKFSFVFDVGSRKGNFF